MGGILPLLRAYSFRHLHSPPLHRPFQDSFAATGTLPYHEEPLQMKEPSSVASVANFQVPTIFGAGSLDW